MDMAERAVGAKLASGNARFGSSRALLGQEIAEGFGNDDAHLFGWHVWWPLPIGMP